jgi:hypothetical protein
MERIQNGEDLDSEKMGFNSVWINWMRICVTILEYHILVNDKKVGQIIPKKSLETR